MHSGPSQISETDVFAKIIYYCTSKVELFAKIVNYSKLSMLKMYDRVLNTPLL